MTAKPSSSVSRSPGDPLRALIDKWRAEDAVLHLDMLQVDRLYSWARNIRNGGGSDITSWGRPAFVADMCCEIAASIEAEIKANPRKRVDELEAALTALPVAQGQGWQPIETWTMETNERVRVLVYSPRFGVQMGHIYRYPDGQMFVNGDGFHGEWGVTHYMGLPAPPILPIGDEGRREE